MITARCTDEHETKKRKPAIRLPDGLLARMRRWRRNQLFVVEWNGQPVERVRAFSAVVVDAGLGDDVACYARSGSAFGKPKSRSKHGIERVEKADWVGPVRPKDKYRNASIIKDDRAIFNIKENDYRLVVEINCHHRVVYVPFVGTHAKYDKVNVE